MRRLLGSSVPRFVRHSGARPSASLTRHEGRVTRVPRPLVPARVNGRRLATHLLPWAFATSFTRPFRRPRREPGPGRVTRSLRSLRSTSLHSSTRPTRGRSVHRHSGSSSLTFLVTSFLFTSLSSRPFGRERIRPEPTHERRGVSRLLSSASFHLPLVSLTSFPRLVIPSLLSVFPRLAHSVPSVILTPFGLRSYRSAPRGFASRFLHSLPPAFVSGRNRPGGRSLPHASLAVGAPRGT